MSGTSSGGELVAVGEGNAVVRDFMQSRNFDCAVRRDWKEVDRCVSSASSWDGAGNVWFKIFATKGPTIDQNKQQAWPGQSEWQFLVFRN